MILCIIFEDLVLFSTLKTPNFSAICFWELIKIAQRIIYNNNHNNNNTYYVILYSGTIDSFLRNALI